jgi:hypothetical protein
VLSACKQSTREMFVFRSWPTTKEQTAPYSASPPRNSNCSASTLASFVLKKAKCNLCAFKAQVHSRLTGQGGNSFSKPDTSSPICDRRNGTVPWYQYTLSWNVPVQNRGIKESRNERRGLYPQTPLVTTHIVFTYNGFQYVVKRARSRVCTVMDALEGQSRPEHCILP